MLYAVFDIDSPVSETLKIVFCCCSALHLNILLQNKLVAKYMHHTKGVPEMGN